MVTIDFKGYMNDNNQKSEAFVRREETIIHTAFQLFADHGIESVTIDMIAETAGIGKGTVYKHFVSKNDIFACLVIHHGEELMNLLMDVPQDVPVMVQLKKIMRTVWDFQTRDMDQFAVYRQCDQLLFMKGLSPGVRERFEAQNEKRNAFIKSMIQKGIDEEIFMDESLENLSALAIGLFRGVFDLVLQGDVNPTEELYQLLENMIFKGFIR